MDKGNYDVQIKRWTNMDKGGHYDVEMKGGWMDY